MCGCQREYVSEIERQTQREIERERGSRREMELETMVFAELEKIENRTGSQV